MKNINGFIKWFFVSLAIAGIIWNAAVLHNEVGHIKDDVQEIKTDIQDIKTYLLLERGEK